MSFTPNIQAFCCHYTSQQSLAEGKEGLSQDGMPANVTINRMVCGGKLQVSSLLKAFEDGADGVYVVACPPDKCHNVKGSERAGKRTAAVKKALTELGVEAERVEMYHMERGLHPEFIVAAREMNKRITDLGPCPFNGGSK